MGVVIAAGPGPGEFTLTRDRVRFEYPWLLHQDLERHGGEDGRPAHPYRASRESSENDSGLPTRTRRKSG